MPRTATSWVGKMLEASGALMYVNEPLNPQHPPGRLPRVVVTVRDPVSTVSSWRRLGWTPRLAELLGQPAVAGDLRAVAAYRHEIPGLEVVRHEDLSADPVPAFAALYGRLGLPFGPDPGRAIRAATGAGLPGPGRPGRPGTSPGGRRGW